MWHLWYFLGVGGGLCAAAFIIFRAVRQVRRENTREARSDMIWTTIGAVLMMPLSGIMLAAIIFMVTQ